MTSRPRPAPASDPPLPPPPSAGPGRAIGLGRYLPLVLAILGLIACAWPVALPGSAWAWLLPVLALPIVALVLLGAAWPERRAASTSWGLLATAAAAGLALALLLAIWQARHAVALPRLFPRWWLFTLAALMVLSMAGIPRNWGRLLCLAVAQTLLFVAAIEPAFGVHPLWAVVAGLLLLTGWGVADRTAGRQCGARLLAMWCAASLLLVLLGYVVLTRAVIPGLEPLRAALGLRPGPLSATRLDRAGPDPGWLGGSEVTRLGPRGGDAAAEDVDSDRSEHGGAPVPAADAAAGSDAPPRDALRHQAAGAQDRDAFLSWQVRLDDTPLDPNDRTPLVTVRMRRSWSGRVAQAALENELRLWKTAALDAFDGWTWEQSSTAGEVIPAEAGVCFLEPIQILQPDRAIGQELLVHSAEVGGLPFVGHPVAVGGQFSWLLRHSGGALVPDGDLQGGRRFRVISVARTGAGPAGEAPTRGHREIPTLPRLLTRARELGANEAPLDPVAYLDRALRDLRERCTYGMAVPLPGGEAPVEAFLFEAQPGSCEHFATAFALLARAAGIPSRLAVGFLAPPAGELDAGAVTLTRAERHAWVEVWLADRGWVPVDPSPGGSAGAGEAAPTAGLPGAWRRWVVLAGACVGLALFAATRLWLRRRASAAAPPQGEPVRIVVRVPERRRRAPSGREEAAVLEWDRRVMLLHRRVLAAARWLGLRARSGRGADRMTAGPTSRGPWEELREQLERHHPPLGPPLRAYDRAWRRAMFGPDQARAVVDLEPRAEELLGRFRDAGRERASLESRRERA